MYAIIRTGGRQFRAEPGQVIDVEKMLDAQKQVIEPGTVLNIEDVLLVVPDSAEPRIGTPRVQGVTVQATVVEHYRAQKVLIWKYRPGLRYRRRRGHRQTYTRLRIESIDGL